MKPLWYRLDEGDADPATLFYYLGLAAKQIASRRKKALPLFTPEYRHGLTIFTRNYFRELFTRLPQPFLIVLDNYQDLGSETPVHDVIQNALEELPEHGSIIVMSRTEPPAQVARLRANGELKIINPESMRVTSEEALGIAESRTGEPLSDQCLRVLVEQTRGWAAGLVLLLELRCAGGPESERDSEWRSIGAPNGGRASRSTRYASKSSRSQRDY